MKIKDKFKIIVFAYILALIFSCKNAPMESPAPESAPADDYPAEAATDDTITNSGGAGIASEKGEFTEEEIALYSKEFLPVIPGGYKYMIANNKTFFTLQTFGEVDSLIEKYLNMGGFISNRRFEVNGGFGIATEVEKVKSNGDSENSTNRFKIDFDFSKCEGNWLTQFLYPRSACKVRMFIFIFSNQPLQSKPDEKLSLQSFTEWWDNGYSSLPYSLSIKKIDRSYKLNILVYEYEVADMSSEGKLNKSGLTAIDHLKKAKLWQQEMGL